MPRAGINALRWTRCFTTRGVPCQCVEVCGNPRQHAEHPCMVKRDKLAVILGIRTQVHRYHLTTLEPREPVNAPPQHFDFVGNAGFHDGLGRGASGICLRLRGHVTSTKVRQPLGHLAGVVVLKELVNTAAAQAGSGGDLSNRQPGLVGGHDRPDALAFGVFESCSRQLESGLQLSFMLDTLSECFTSFHAPRILACEVGVQ